MMQEHCMAYMNDGFCSRPNCQYLHKGGVESNEFEFLYFWNFKPPSNVNYFNQVKRRRFPDYNPNSQGPVKSPYRGSTSSSLQSEKERIRLNREQMNSMNQPNIGSRRNEPVHIKIQNPPPITNDHPDAIIVNDITDEDILKDGFLGQNVDEKEAQLFRKWMNVKLDDPDVPFINGTAVSRNMRKEAIKALVTDFLVKFNGNQRRAVVNSMEEESKCFANYKMSTNAYMSSIAGLKKRIRSENMKRN